MTIDLYDDVLMPFVIGFLVVLGFTIIIGWFYLRLEKNTMALFFMIFVSCVWAIGFVIWRRHIYG